MFPVDGGGRTLALVFLLADLERRAKNPEGTSTTERASPVKPAKAGEGVAEAQSGTVLLAAESRSEAFPFSLRELI
jgi:hypothetical protein